MEASRGSAGRERECGKPRGAEAQKSRTKRGKEGIGLVEQGPQKEFAERLEANQPARSQPANQPAQKALLS
eukprot:1147512-Pleurochrysis_carterae.AAC.2